MFQGFYLQNKEYKVNTALIHYQGSLRTEAKHLKSGQKIITDAPIDNEGKGEAFSPSDLLCTSLASCMLTIMGIEARRQNLDIKGVTAEMKKIMSPSPRRVGEIQISFSFPRSYQTKEKELLEKAAIHCPVAQSLSNSVKQTISFHYLT